MKTFIKAVLVILIEIVAISAIIFGCVQLFPSKSAKVETPQTQTQKAEAEEKSEVENEEAEAEAELETESAEEVAE